MRGTQIFLLVGLEREGIIPAHAGNTSICRTRLLASRDHPRACGEHSRFVFFNFGVSGSSPRMRGTPSMSQNRPCVWGIIPAHAGNTSRHGATVRRSWDHPRACGEHLLLIGGLESPSGSSPRMRGTPLLVCDTGQWHGIIPAHAGNTITCTSRRA